MKLSYMMTCIGIMALVTYLPRMIPLVFMKRKIENRFVQSFFHYVPYAVLSAMTFPDILFSTGGGFFSALIGLIVGLLLAWWGKGLVLVALGASTAVFLAERVLALL